MPNRAELVAVLLQNLQNTTEVLVSLNESSNGELKDAMTLVRKLQRQQNRMFASLGMPPGYESDDLLNVCLLAAILIFPHNLTLAIAQ